MNRKELKEWFARTRRVDEEALVGERSLINEQPKQTGRFTPEEYILQGIIVDAWEAGVRWALGELTMQADRAAGDLEDGILDAGLAIPPVGSNTRSDLQKLYSTLEDKKREGSYDDSFSKELYDARDEDEDTEDETMGFSEEYEEMIRSGRIYDK